MRDDRDVRSLDEKLAPQDFVTDFVWAARAVFSQPSVALVSIALWCFPTVFARLAPRSNVMALVYLVAVLFMLGWDGIERIFFLAHRDGKKVTLAQLLASVPFFLGRFLRLASLLGMVVFPLVWIMFVLADRSHPAATQAAQHAVHHIELATLAVPIDIALTFVTSALVFTTRSARQALRIGLGMIRQTWPRSGLYVLCPPLALNMLNVIYPTNILAVSLVTTSGLALLALLAKGSTAAFYLREHPVSPDVVGDVI
jgi:hypothetical protein